jgi:uncharacterized 2Fe-2S/4Fe-4S cluster protein (DUF4445 family)
MPLLVEFEPAGVVVLAEEGANLLDVAAEAGVQIDAPCGGQGRCGRCKVRLADGGDGGPLRARSNARLTPEERAKGYALCCQTFVEPQAGSRGHGDRQVKVVVPRPHKKRLRQLGHSQAQPDILRAHGEWKKAPPIRTETIAIEPPSLADNTSDLDRLTRELARQCGVAEVRVPLDVLRQLGHTLRAADWKVAVTLETAEFDHDARLSPRVVSVAPAHPPRGAYGLAIDVGTTGVVVYLVQLRSGKVVDSAGAYNAQIACGDDVISRIVYSQRGHGLGRLQQLVVGTIAELIDELVARSAIEPTDIDEVTVAGNTVMTHFLLALDPKYLREEPYIPTLTTMPSLVAGQLGLKTDPQAHVFVMPAVGSYVGGDVAAGVLSSGMYATDKLTLFMDVGTNGEIVLGNREWLICCACSAGPAFEGAGVTCGMRATTGAIEDIWIDGGTFEPSFRVVDDAAPQGLCGSGLIDVLAELFVTGALLKGGRFARGLDTPRIRESEHGLEYVVAWAPETGNGRDIVLTETDIDSLLRAKAAMYAGFSVLCRSVGVDIADVEQFLVGGAFGQFINVEKAIQIGLLPDLPVERFRFLGNTSALGAYIALLAVDARREVGEIAGRMTYLELSADNSFMDEYTSALFLPHTDLDAFPTVRALLERDGSAGEPPAAEGDHPTAAGVQPVPEGEYSAAGGGDEVAVLRTMTARAAPGGGDGASSARQPLAKRGEAV